MKRATNRHVVDLRNRYRDYDPGAVTCVSAAGMFLLAAELVRLRAIEAACRTACAELDPSHDEAQVLTAIRAELEQLAPIEE